MAESLEPTLPAGRIAFTYPDFTIYQAARFFIVAALEMQSVAVGWRDHPASSRSGIDRLGPVSPRHAPVSGFGTCGGPLRPAQSGHVVLLRLRRCFRTAVGDCLEP